MIARPTRILTAFIVFLFFFQCKILAVTRYVNINNPTPGGGTSWATAFNSLQQALAVAGVFDHIWVAQGTYKPSSPAGRSATFLLPGGTTVLGGFNGTETAEPQRNPTLYPTILSGDIGVAGDRSDNCYHVVTAEGGLWSITFKGFTIRDGQADAGYPASTVAAADNTGGGLAVIAHPGELSYIQMYDLVFTNNFAVYGGGLGGFSDGGTQTNQNGSSLLFNGNSAIYGGAMANIASNGDWAPFSYSSCIFINNTAAGGNASVMYQSFNNPTSSQTYLQNCLFYDEAAPMVTSLTAGPNNYFDVQNSIIWTSGSPYTGGYANGNSPVTFDFCDIDGALPSGDFDADPMFVNAAGGDFHVSPCSPVVDAGFPWTFPGAALDLDDKDRVQGTIDIGPYEQVKGTAAAAPTVTSTVLLCQNGPASPLTASGAAGASFLWYSASSGGTGSSTAPTPSTVSVGSTTYYVTQTPAGSCESPRAAITVHVAASPAKPVSGTPLEFCEGQASFGLSVSGDIGASFLWYNAATGGVGYLGPPTPSTASAGETDYYVTQTVNGCESARLEVQILVDATPAAPAGPSPSPSYCIGDVAAPLTATGNSLQWYTSIGGPGSGIAPIPATTSAGTTNYYVTQRSSNGCVSAPTTIAVTVGSPSAAPTAGSPSYCIGDVAPALTATGAAGTSFLWYNAATGGTGSSTAPVPSTASAGATNYYVSQTAAGSCESGRTLVTVTVNSPSASPVGPSPSPSYCVGDVAAALTATGTNLLWYTSIGGPGSATAPTPVTTSIGTTNYYVTQQPTGGCVSAPTTIVVTVGSPAAAPTAGSPSYCVGDVVPALTATGAAGASFLWYNTAAGGTGSSTAPVPSTVAAGSTSYYVTQKLSGGCESPRKEVDVTVKPLPSAAFTWSGACEGKPTIVTAASSGGAQYSWDFGSGASVSGVGSGPYEVTWANGSGGMVTLTATAGGCQASTKHLITVNHIPKVGIAPVGSALCAGSSVPLEAYGATSFQWSPATGLSNPNIANPVVRLQNNIQYTVTGVDDNGCSASAQVTLDVSPDCLVYSVPDAFTPNGDGANDVFRVKTGDSPKAFSLIVFNRWGAKVFESPNAGSGWDGRIGGSGAPAGAYIYVLQATTSTGVVIKKQGTVLLVR